MNEPINIKPSIYEFQGTGLCEQSRPGAGLHTVLTVRLGRLNRQPSSYEHTNYEVGLRNVLYSKDTQVIHRSHLCPRKPVGILLNQGPVYTELATKIM